MCSKSVIPILGIVEALIKINLRPLIPLDRKQS